MGGGWGLRAWFATVLVACCAMAQAARVTTPLDGPWRFLRGDVAGAEVARFDDSRWATVTLPHTWNAGDGEAGGPYYRGPSWYRLTLPQPAPRAGRRTFLEFDGAALVADVWINGRHLGRHEGGYARFRFDISDALLAGANTLAVRVDNATQPQVAPLGGDFTVFGGLYRQVRLIETAEQHLDLLDHGGPGMSIATQDVSAVSTGITVAARLRNDDAHPQPLSLRLLLRDAQGRTVASHQQALSLPAGTTELAKASLQLARPRLWQGRQDPYLYRLTADVLRRQQVIDSVTIPLGIRSVAVDPQRGFLLNGHSYPLHGVNYFHAGRPGRGVAVGPAEIEEDFRILNELGATGLRLVHYQHPARAYELADELGLLVWTEIPLNAAMDEGPAFRANLAQQLRELQAQTGHHPSVAIWGLGNEVYRSDEPIRALLAALHAQAKQDDPSRPTVYAHCCAADDHPMALAANLTGYNRYWGWYDGSVQDIGPWADALHARLPQRPIGLGEYGAGASVLHQRESAQRPEPTGPWHPEQFQSAFHEAYWSQIQARPWLWGSFVWLAFDHASAGRNEGDLAGINDKGLVTYDRRFRKDAFHFYRAQWTRTPMVHITSRRLTPRPAGPTAVKVYTNASRVSLALNGQPLGSLRPVGGVAEWPQLMLPPGRNRVDARTDTGATDHVVWEAQP